MLLMFTNLSEECAFYLGPACQLSRSVLAYVKKSVGFACTWRQVQQKLKLKAMTYLFLTMSVWELL